jgi:hypothetical protein
MKTRKIQFAAVLTMVLLSTSMVSAQTTSIHTMLRANIPFTFIAGGVHLAAGEYHVYHPGNPYIIVIENRDATAHAMTYVRPSAINPAQNTTKLLFNKYGDQYFLAEIWTERNQEVHQCFKCRMEQTLIAKSKKPTTVVVAAMH